MLRRLLLRCYPARWRQRYGDEFAVVLEERPLGPFDVADVLLGALDAHLHLSGLGAASAHRKGFAMSLRVGGLAAIVGGLLWIIALAGSALTGDGVPWAWLLVGATVALLVALIGLSAFQARRFPLLTWAAFVVPALGACVSIVGLIAMAVVGDRPFVGDLSPWYVWMIGTLTLTAGSALFAIATWRTANLSRPAAVALAVGAVAIVPLLAGLSGDLLPEAISIAASALAMLAFAAGWAGLGLSALRTDRAAAAGPYSAAS